MQYTCGQAIAMLPSFLTAHYIIQPFTSYPADGFSFPYQICIGMGMLLYSLLGLYFLRKVLLIYFLDSTVAFTLLVLCIGTIYLNYGAIDQAQANPFLFFAYSVLLYQTERFYKTKQKSLLYFIAIWCGFITLIRPTDIVCVFIPLLWGCYNLTDIFSRSILLWRHKNSAVYLLILFGGFPLLQFIYWKYVLGVWFAYSYNDQGFTWLHPHFTDFLFSAHSGFLRYCSTMVLSFVGLYYIWKQKIQSFALIFIILISLYITAAWDIWDYGWYSGRAMIQYFAVYAFALAALFQSISSVRWQKGVLWLLIAMGIYFNIWWTYHIHAGNIPSMHLTNIDYWKNVGRWRLD